MSLTSYLAAPPRDFIFWSLSWPEADVTQLFLRCKILFDISAAEFDFDEKGVRKLGGSGLIIFVECRDRGFRLYSIEWGELFSEGLFSFLGFLLASGSEREETDLGEGGTDEHHEEKGEEGWFESEVSLAEFWVEDSDWGEKAEKGGDCGHMDSDCEVFAFTGGEGGEKQREAEGNGSEGGETASFVD